MTERKSIVLRDGEMHHYNRYRDKMLKELFDYYSENRNSCNVPDIITNCTPRLKFHAIISSSVTGEVVFECWEWEYDHSCVEFKFEKEVDID